MVGGSIRSTYDVRTYTCEGTLPKYMQRKWAITAEHVYYWSVYILHNQTRYVLRTNVACVNTHILTSLIERNCVCLLGPPVKGPLKKGFFVVLQRLSPSRRARVYQTIFFGSRRRVMTLCGSTRDLSLHILSRKDRLYLLRSEKMVHWFYSFCI